jgi:hypothetical protein
MSRKLVLVSVFVALLPALLVAVRAQSRDEYGDADPFGSPPADRPSVSKPPKPEVVVVKPKPYSGPKLQGGEEAILKALKEETSIDCTNSPLKDVLQYFSEKHRIPVRMDSPALKEAGVEECAPITCKLSGIPLRSALGIILDDLQLVWTIDNDVLTITSPNKAESYEFLVTKSYDVADLVVFSKSYDQIPSAAVDSPANYSPLMSMAGGFQQVTGPGQYSGNARGTPHTQTDVQPIMDAITNIVATKDWADNGGCGTIAQHDRVLLISQTFQVHTQIEQFLADLRARRQARPTLSVELQWLWLDAKQHDRLLAGQAKAAAGQLSPAVDPERLRQIAHEVPGYYGLVTCANGLGTAIAAGDQRWIITGAVPVVGGDGVGYQPLVTVAHVGVAAQLRPTVVPGTKTAMLDIASLISRWDPSRKSVTVGSAWPSDHRVVAWNPPPASTPAQNAATAGPATPPQPVAPIVTTHSTQGGSSSCPVDQPVMPAQQLGTTLCVPLGKPVIVGAITFAPTEGAGLGAAGENPVQVYLIATTSIVREEIPTAPVDAKP